MQEELNGSDKDVPEDAKRPRQGNGVRTNTRWERESCNIAPETCNRDDRQDVCDDDPAGQSARFDRTASAKLDQEKQGKNRTGGGAGQRPSDGAGETQEIKKCGNQGKGGDQEATFNIEAHEAEMPVGELASQRALERNNHRRKAGK